MIRGFTDAEVDELYQRYLRKEQSPKVSREGLELWYDGYQTVTGRQPRYVGRILAVGLAYDRKKKRHSCQIEILREKTIK